MTKQKVYREYLVLEKTDENEGEALSYEYTRADAREAIKALGGRKAGFKIVQNKTIVKEVR